MTQNHLFPKKKIGFSTENQLFPGIKLVFGPKPSCSWEKVGFPTENQLVPRENKKTMFLEFGRIVSQKMIVLFFGKNWFVGPKPSFS